MTANAGTPLAFRDLPLWKQTQAWRAKTRDLRCACGGYWSSGWAEPPEPGRPGHSPDCPHYRVSR